MNKETKGIKRPVEKLLTRSGKVKLFDAIKECIVARVDMELARMNLWTPEMARIKSMFIPEEVTEKLEQAEKNLKEMLDYIKIRVR